MTRLRAEARIALAGAHAVIHEVSEHLVGHGATIRREGGATLIDHAGASGILSADERHLFATIESPDIASLQELRGAIASHVVEFAPRGEPPRIVWQGDGASLAAPPDFRILTVTGARDLTPRMRRIHFEGETLARFDRLDALHVRLFFPPAGDCEPQWPMLGEDGLVRQPPPDRRLAVRKYTIREIDVAAGRLAIDFVLHGDAGPGTAFASRARPGDRIGMAGPGGRGLREADFTLLLADETGLPAVARMLAALPAAARGLALLEVAPGEEQELAGPAGFAIRWLGREGAPGQALVGALDALPQPIAPGRVYLWSACEHGAFREIRARARQRLRPEGDHHLVISYWRQDHGEDQGEDPAEDEAA